MFTCFKRSALLAFVVATCVFSVQSALSSQSESIKLSLGAQKGVKASVELHENVALSKTNLTVFDVNLTLQDISSGSIYQSGRAALSYTSSSKYGSNIIILESKQGYFSGGPLVIERGTKQSLEVVCLLNDGVSRKYATAISIKR